MKKKAVISVVVISALIISAALLYFMPVTFGRNVKPSEVNRINVFDGSTGTAFTISDPGEIKYIVENIQSHPMKKDGISLGRKGYSLRISYIDSNEKNVLPVFILNSDDTIRKDPFFCVCDGGLCFDYVKELEEIYKPGVTETSEGN